MPQPSFQVDQALKDFVESAVATVVGTGSRDGRPCIAYGWGARVSEDGEHVDVFLDRLRADQTLANLQDNGKIAMTVADPISYRSAQLKGCFIESEEPTEVDHAWVQRHREMFLITTTLVGDSPTAMRNRWLDDIIRVTFRAECAFDQTPGRHAGIPLAGGSALGDPV
jgi:hypothetical protein